MINWKEYAKFMSGFFAWMFLGSFFFLVFGNFPAYLPKLRFTWTWEMSFVFTLFGLIGFCTSFYFGYIKK